MDALRKLIESKKKGLNGKEVFLRGDVEREKREKYEEEKKKLKEIEEEKLGKRLQKLDDFYENSSMVKPKEMFEPMKRVITLKKKNKKSVREEEEKEKKVSEVDTSRRDGSRA